MAQQTRSKQFSAQQPEAADLERRRDQPLADAPASVPHSGEEVGPSGSQPPEDGGVGQHPIHDSDVEDLAPEDFEEMTDKVETTGVKSDS